MRLGRMPGCQFAAPSLIRFNVPRTGVSARIPAQEPSPTPNSMPAPLVAGRALRVPTGATFGRPFPRPAAAGLRRVMGSGQESGDGHRVPPRRRPRVALNTRLNARYHVAV